MDAQPLLVIATPCYGGMMTSSYVDSLLLLQQACHAKGIAFTWLIGSGDALITRARADLMAAFLETEGATHMLFIDADIGFDPGQVFRLMDFDEDVTAGAYPIKAVDYERLRQALRENRSKPEASALHYVLGLEDPAHVVVRGGFAKARNVGNGFLMIRRAAFLKMCNAYPKLKYSKVHARNDARQNSPYRFALFDTMIDEVTGEYLSEDYAFCRRWRAIGGEIWVDLESRLTHVGPMKFAGDLSAQFDRAK